VGREPTKNREAGKPGKRRLRSADRDQFIQPSMKPLRWPASGIRSTIAPNEVHLWGWPLEPATSDLAAHIELLDATELRRLQAFHFAADAGRYAVAHANLRRILGGYCDRPPAKICFRANRFGKPELADEDASSSIQFNLAHSRSIALLAVAHGRPLGVDVEDVRPIEPEVAAAHFSAREISDLSGLQGDAWLNGFYRCWTRKEAILKAEGVGLHRALDSFDVGLLADVPAELLGTREEFSYPWKLYDLSPAAGSIAALATAYSNARLACFSFLS
jgi:4'-phosphopantetheinyl transferase